MFYWQIVTVLCLCLYLIRNYKLFVRRSKRRKVFFWIIRSAIEGHVKLGTNYIKGAIKLTKFSNYKPTLVVIVLSTLCVYAGSDHM